MTNSIIKILTGSLVVVILVIAFLPRPEPDGARDSTEPAEEPRETADASVSLEKIGAGEGGDFAGEGSEPVAERVRPEEDESGEGEVAGSDLSSEDAGGRPQSAYERLIAGGGGPSEDASRSSGPTGDDSADDALARVLRGDL